MRGMAREYAAGNARGPGWREFAGTLGQLQPGRQAGSGMARSRAKARVNWDSQGQRRGRCRVLPEAARRAGDPSHQSEDPPPEGLGGYGPFAQTNPRLVRIYHRGRLIKVHPRQDRGGRSTDPDDYPAELSAYTLRAPEQIKRSAASQGPPSSGRGYAPSPGPPARRRWLRNAGGPTACGSARRRT